MSKKYKFDRPYEKNIDPENGREILLEVKDADIHFKIGRKTIKACNNINFKIYKGETFGLVGESGSGKTTISRAILGINKLTRGSINFHGLDISKKLKRKEILEVKKNIQMIFQDPAASLNERANVDYIVSEGLYNFGLYDSEEERRQKAADMLRNVGLLPEHLTRYPHEFSGGQRQRIGIARALVIEPELVLADEPISALDVSIRAQVLNLLKDLQVKKSLTYLFIAHDLSIIRYISDRIAVMHLGYFVELGTSEQIYSRPAHPYTKSLLTAIPQPDPISERNRKRIPYNQDGINYSECEWIEIEEGHFVLANDELLSKWGLTRYNKDAKLNVIDLDQDNSSEKTLENEKLISTPIVEEITSENHEINDDVQNDSLETSIPSAEEVQDDEIISENHETNDDVQNDSLETSIPSAEEVQDDESALDVKEVVVEEKIDADLENNEVVKTNNLLERDAKENIKKPSKTAKKQVKKSDDVITKLNDLTLKVLESYTVAELKQMAKESGITGFSKMKKQELIDALRNNK